MVVRANDLSGLSSRQAGDSAHAIPSPTWPTLSAVPQRRAVRVGGHTRPTSSGGGQATAALRPIQGRERVARYALGIADKVADATILERNVNGQPGLVVQQAGATVSVVAFTVTGDRITRIWAVRNPEKLRSWPTQLCSPRRSSAPATWPRR
jgi:hypothetical protein